MAPTGLGLAHLHTICTRVGTSLSSDTCCKHTQLSSLRNHFLDKVVLEASFMWCTGGEVAFQAAIDGFLEKQMVLPTCLRRGWLL